MVFTLKVIAFAIVLIWVVATFAAVIGFLVLTILAALSRLGHIG